MYKSKSKANAFYQLIHDLFRSFTQSNKLFIHYYLELRKIILKGQEKTNDMREVLLYGGDYQLSQGQVELLLKMISEIPTIRALSFIFTRMGNETVKHLAKCFRIKKWCGFKHNQPTLFYLDLSYNYFDWEPVKSLIKSFTDELF